MLRLQRPKTRAQIAFERYEAKLRIDEAHARTQDAVRSNKCPRCGSPLRRNNSMHGWWQCEQFGAPQFRARPDQAPCDWQGFTE